MSKPGDLSAGHYVATSTVDSTRRNLFFMARGRERHIGTLVSGSRTGIAHFDADCEQIVRALDHYDATHVLPDPPAGGADGGSGT